MASAIPELDKEGSQPLIIAMGGAFNPVHSRHIMALVNAKSWIEENTKYRVIAGYLAVSTDGYVTGKCRRAKTKCIASKHRIKLCELACMEHSSWLKPYHRPVGSAQECVKKAKEEFKKLHEYQCIKLAVVIGADRAVNASGFPKWRRNYTDIINVCIGRSGETSRVLELFEKDKKEGNTNNSEFYFPSDELDDVSSTRVRLILREMDEVETKEDKVKIVQKLVDLGWINDLMADYLVKEEKDIYLAI